MSNDKVLLITGASSDVGLELIRSIGSNYKIIWAHYRSSLECFEDLKAEYGEKIIPIQANFSELESTKKFILKIKESEDFPDHIVHLSAPKVHSVRFHKDSWESYQRELDTSLRSITMILQEFIPKMSKKKYGKIVFMLSAYLAGVSPKFQSPYIIVKYALLGLMRNLASEYAGKGITVNGVSPDMMETKFLSELPELIKELSAQSSPIGRNIYVQEVIPTIEFLLSSGSDRLSGQNIAIMGGR